MTRDEAIAKRDRLTRETGTRHIAYQVIPHTAEDHRITRLGSYAVSTPEAALIFDDIIEVEE